MYIRVKIKPLMVYGRMDSQVFDFVILDTISDHNVG